MHNIDERIRKFHVISFIIVRSSLIQAKLRLLKYYKWISNYNLKIPSTQSKQSKKKKKNTKTKERKKKSLFESDELRTSARCAARKNSMVKKRRVGEKFQIITLLLMAHLIGLWIMGDVCEWVFCNHMLNTLAYSFMNAYPIPVELLRWSRKKNQKLKKKKRRDDVSKICIKKSSRWFSITNFWMIFNMKIPSTPQYRFSKQLNHESYRNRCEWMEQRFQLQSQSFI